MDKKSTLLFAVTALVFAGSPTRAADSSLSDALSSMHIAGGSDDSIRFEISPGYSDELGLSVGGAIGGWLSEEVALGLIVEYGPNKREVLVNAGIQFSDTTSLIGTIGQLKEDIEFIDGNGRVDVTQMEYGVSLGSDIDFFLASGVELNAYATDAESDSADAIAGRLYGIQYKSVFDLTDTTQVITGSGYEWVEWDDDTDNESGFTHSLEVRQWVGDELSLFGSGFIGTTETRYGGGLDMSFDTAAATHRLRLEYTHIDGHEGIHDDDRVQGTWSIGFGTNYTRRETTDNALTDRSGTIHATASTYTRPHNGRLLDQIMKRSKALPQRSVAKQVSVICGNGNVEPGEQCDDGNTLNSDGCSSQCTIEAAPQVCGNGIVEAAEECDDGNTLNGDFCSSQCTIETTPGFCGNGIVEAAEECDDGNPENDDFCTNQCTIVAAP